MDIDSEWLYLISDTDNSETGVTENLQQIVDGNNLAFIYNVSRKDALSCAVSCFNLKMYYCNR